MDYTSPGGNPLPSLVNDAHQDSTVLNRLGIRADLARMVVTVQATLPPNLHTGDFLLCETADQSAFNSVQLTTAVLIKTSAVHTTTTDTCQMGVPEIAPVFCAENVNLVLQKHCSRHGVEPVKTATITGSGPLLFSTPWHLVSSFFGRIPSYVL